jgi:hypothetical protein
MIRRLISVVGTGLILVATAQAAAPTAGKLVYGLKAHHLPITKVMVYTAANDPNGLLGRPNGYISAAHFLDRRAVHMSGSQTFDTSNGGAVEVFASHRLAERRANYIKGILKANPILVGPEYDYVVGKVVLRISGALTRSDAQRYLKVLKTLPGA